MATYSIKAPDGRTIQVRANDEATALRGAQEWAAANPAQSAAPQTAQPPEGFRPGTREYADWAAQQARAGNALPKVSPTPPEWVDPRQQPGLIDAVAGTTAATADGILNAIPVVGQGLRTITAGTAAGLRTAIDGGDFGENYSDVIEDRDYANRQYPISNIAGNLAGGIGSAAVGGLGATGARALGFTGTLGQQMLNSGLSTLGLTTADNIIRGQKPVDALVAAGLPSVAGAAIPGIGAAARSGAEQVANAATRSAQRKLTDAAIADAPAAQDLKSVASALFKEVDDSGTAIKSDFFADRVYRAAQSAEKELIDSELDAPAVRLYNILADRTRQAFESGKGISLGELHNMRQIAQDIVIKGGGDRTGRFADQIVNMIDDIAGNLKPEQLTLPANRLGNPKEAGNALLTGISTWARARRVDLIEEALYKAQNQASGVENGLRTQFRTLLQNKKTRNLFSPAEREAIEKVANGTGLSNLTRLLGTFGFELGSGRNAIGGALGLLAGGPVGAIIGTGSRKLAEVMAQKAGQRAANVVATPNIPTAAQRVVPPQILAAIQAAQTGAKGAVVGGTAASEGQPLRVIVNGAGSYNGY